MNFAVIPRITEKGYKQAAKGTFIFTVPYAANKQQVAEAVAKQFDVTVTSVNVLVQNGKAVRTHRGNGKYASGVRAHSKKAYVRLAEGQTIPAFEETK